ncbi:hypothetical protein TanjilG_04024 [Lupinus angustifolius]|uniref:DUF3741 domain-containing protein n=1 Tax=Lupinus angustifolius TaxID=3871 RepID=A0A4P1RB22_LUPAN|nr:PREDICTED: uncharacterized protein LOC109354647 [Lupinus angustifolius]OIW06630.1 hypothetical protein TanjilG_04024 [Lupinus angustifolius]
MGKDYWNWSGSRSSKSKRSRPLQTAEIPSGCMCAVFQLFDFHPFHFSLNQQQQHQQQQQQHQQQQPSFNSSSHNVQQDLQTVPKGAEAPRNSLESEDGTISTISKDENLKIPKNIRIRTSGARGGNLNDFSSEIISSPGTKTPTLVARLMGLDLLPDAVHSSSSSSSSCLSTPNQQGHHPHVNHHFRQRQQVQLVKHRNSTGSYNNGGIRSLHETPRSSDVEHRRLSLQINKENMDLDLPQISFSKSKCNNENYNYSSSRNHYARQIVKQVKESVSRKVGLDITNTVKIREKEREEFVNQLRLKKSLKKSVDESSPGKHSSQSHSPGLSRFIDTKNNPSTKLSSQLTPKDQNIILKPQSPSPLANVEAQVSRVLTKARPQALPDEQELQNQKPAPKCKKIGKEKFSSMLKKPQQKSSIRKKQEEAFVIRPPPSPRRDNDIKTKTKTKRTHPLPCNVLKNLNTTVSTLHPVKTCPSPPATKIPQKQVSETREPKWSTQLSICSSQRYKQEALAHTLATQGRVTNVKNKSNGVSTTTEEGAEFQYISTILTRTTAPHQWYPSNFHQLELYPTYNSTLSSTHNDKDSIFTRNNQPGPRCNQRLLFDLIGQVLSEILVKPKYCNYDNGVSLLETVWNKVGSFPRAKCEVLEDIDGLIEMKDEEEEGREREEGLVAEIEENIFETLVHETVTVMVGGV